MLISKYDVLALAAIGTFATVVTAVALPKIQARSKDCNRTQICEKISFRNTQKVS